MGIGNASAGLGGGVVIGRRGAQMFPPTGWEVVYVRSKYRGPKAGHVS